MRLRYLLLPAALGTCLTGGCTREAEPTPPSVRAHFHALVDSLAKEMPGAASSRLTFFLDGTGGYTLADTVRTELDRVRTEAAGWYHEARQMARAGDFDYAEAVLQDLATHLADTPAGQSARQHLAYDFHYGQAQWLVTNQRFDEAETVARRLLKRDLSAEQTRQVEAMLDNLVYVDTAMGMAERSQVRAACRQVTIMLLQEYAMEGRYPSRLSLAEVERRDPHGFGAIGRSLSKIEDYRTTSRGVSFVGVGKEGKQRVRVVDGQIED